MKEPAVWGWFLSVPVALIGQTPMFWGFYIVWALAAWVLLRDFMKWMQRD